MRTFDSTIFKGVSLKFHNVDTADKDAADLLSLPSVKAAWPISLYSLPDDEVIWTGTPESSTVARRQDTNTTADTFSPHVMTQVDKLRAEGIVGAGIKIAVIDTGVSSRANAPSFCSPISPFGGTLAGNCEIVLTCTRSITPTQPLAVALVLAILSATVMTLLVMTTPVSTLLFRMMSMLQNLSPTLMITPILTF